MNTQTHMLMGAALFGSAADESLTAAAVLGGLAPDLPMILMVLGARWVQRKSPREIFGTLYFLDGWQRLLAPWHSLPLWGAGLAAGWAAGSKLAIAFAASGLLHIAIDFFLHAHDAHRQLWPFSNWRFQSPVSYWDSRFHGRLFRQFELVLMMALAVALLVQHWSLWAGAVVAVVVVLYGAQLSYFWRMAQRHGR